MPRAATAAAGRFGRFPPSGGLLGSPLERKSMPRRTTAAVLLASALSTLAAAAAEAPLSADARRAAVTLRDKAAGGTRASEWTRSLSDRVGPRPAGSEGDRAAVAWALATMKTLGFA